MGAITKTSIPLTNALNFYFFFYDWQISSDETICSSERVPVNVDINNSVGEILNVESINLYPIPATDIININLEIIGTKNLVVTLRDAAGRIISIDNWVNVSSGTQNLDIRSCRAGHYNLTISDGKSRTITQVIIQ